MDHVIRVRDAPTRALAMRTLAELPLSKEWEVVLRPRKKLRTIRQNRRYFGVLRFASEHSGFSETELHELCKAHVLGVEVVTLGGTEIERPRSTARLSTQDFTRYAQSAEAWLVAEMGLRLPAWG